MPTVLLLVLVVGGIGAIAVILHRLGYSRRVRLESPAAASALWAAAHPEQSVQEVVLSTDGHAACLRTSHGAGVIWAHGADFVTRSLVPGRFSCRADPSGLTILMADMTAPKVLVSLAEEDRPLWYAILGDPHR